MGKGLRAELNLMVVSHGLTPTDNPPLQPYRFVSSQSRVLGAWTTRVVTKGDPWLPISIQQHQMAILIRDSTFSLFFTQAQFEIREGSRTVKGTSNSEATMKLLMLI